MATRKCRYGRKKSGACKRKPGPKRGSHNKKRRTRRRSRKSRKSKCRHGRKKTGRRGCKKKPGSKRRKRRKSRFAFGCGGDHQENYTGCPGKENYGHNPNH